MDLAVLPVPVHARTADAGFAGQIRLCRIVGGLGRPAGGRSPATGRRGGAQSAPGQRAVQRVDPAGGKPGVPARGDVPAGHVPVPSLLGRVGARLQGRRPRQPVRRGAEANPGSAGRAAGVPRRRGGRAEANRPAGRGLPNAGGGRGAVPLPAFPGHLHADAGTPARRLAAVAPGRRQPVAAAGRRGGRRHHHPPRSPALGQPQQCPLPPVVESAAAQLRAGRGAGPGGRLDAPGAHHQRHLRRDVQPARPQRLADADAAAAQAPAKWPARRSRCPTP